MFLQSNAGRVAESSSLCDGLLTAKPFKHMHKSHTTPQRTKCKKGSTKYSTPFYTLYYIFLLKLPFSLPFIHFVSIFKKNDFTNIFSMNSINRKILLRDIPSMWGQIQHNNEIIQASFYISRYRLGSHVLFFPRGSIRFYELRFSDG